MKKFTSHLKKDLIRATLLILSVVAFLCPLNQAYATSYELGSLKHSGIYPTGFKTSNNDWTQATPYIYTRTTNSTIEFYPTYVFNRQVPVNNGDILTFQLIYFNDNSELPETDMNWTGWTTLSVDTDFQVMTYEKIRSTFNLNMVCSVTSQSGGLCGEYNGTLTEQQLQDYGSETVMKTTYVLRFDGADNTYISQIVGSGGFFNFRSAERHFMIVKLSTISIYDKSATLQDILEYLENNGDTAGEQMEQNKQETEQAQNDANSAGNTAQSDATSSGQTLLGALTSFIGAITNASPGSCNLTLNTGYGFNLGEVNLCSISPPASFQVISSLVVIGFAVPLSISASKKMIELFRGFTG